MVVSQQFFLLHWSALRSDSVLVGSNVPWLDISPIALDFEGMLVVRFDLIYCALWKWFNSEEDVRLPPLVWNIPLHHQVTCGFGWLVDQHRKSSKCPSVALMFQVGDNATYYNVSLNLSQLLNITSVAVDSCILLFLVMYDELPFAFQFYFLYCFLLVIVMCIKHDPVWLFRWEDAKICEALARVKVVEAMRLTLCTSKLEMPFLDVFMVAIT